MTVYISGLVALAVMPLPWVVVDGLGVPEVGLGTGWIGLVFMAVLFARGKVLTEKDHLERMAILTTAHEAAIAAKDREIDRIDHDRQEWRTESRIKDAQHAELSSQLAEKDKQLSAVGEIARTVDSVLTAIRPLPGGTS